MKIRWLALAFLLVAAGCGDDKPSSRSTGGSGGSDSSGNSASNSPAVEGDGLMPWERDKKPAGTADVTETGKVNDQPAAEDKPAERGFKESKQPEGTTLEGKELNIGTTYNAGDRVKITQLGFSYVVPADSVTYMQYGASVLMIGDTTKQDTAGVIFARTGVTEAEARDMISKEFDLGGGTKLQPVGEISNNGDTLTRRFEGQTLVASATILLGKHTSVGILMYGVPARADFLKEYGAKVAGSLKFATPGGEKDRLKYEADSCGKCVHVFKYKSGGGGASTYSWDSETNKYWHLGTDRTYEYIYKHTGSSSFNDPSARGGHAADTDENHYGTWSIELTLSLPVLVLRTSKGTIIMHTLNLVNGRLHIDGDEATVNPSDRKR